MAKPVPSYVGYDPVADRPFALLASGRKKLLTEDDIPGGGVVNDVSGTGAIDASPTTGNVVVSLDESQLENGGSQELNVAGLSGRLADAQNADTIVTPGGNAAIGGTTGSSGYVLTSNGSGTWSMAANAASGSYANPYIEPPSSAHADNDEFSSGSADLATRGYIVWDATNSVVLTRGGDIDPFSTPAAGTYWSRLTRSYLLIQVCKASNVQIYKSVTSMNGVTGIYWTRVMSQFNNTKTNTNQPAVSFRVWQNNGSNRPDEANHVTLYKDQDLAGGNPRMVFSTRLANVPTNVLNAIASTEFGWSGYSIMGFRFSATNTYQHFTTSDEGEIFAGTAISANAPNKSNLAYVGWGLFQNNTMDSLGGLVAIDFLRRIDGSSNVWIANS